MAVSDYVTGYEHIGVPTNDMDATIEFYETLGFSRLYETDNGGKVIFFGLGDVVIETYEKHGEAAEKRGKGLARVWLRLSTPARLTQRYRSPAR